MRVVSDYQVCSPVNDTMCRRLLIVIRVMVTLYAPVTACDNYRRSCSRSCAIPFWIYASRSPFCDKRLTDTIQSLSHQLSRKYRYDHLSHTLSGIVEHISRIVQSSLSIVVCVIVSKTAGLDGAARHYSNVLRLSLKVPALSTRSVASDSTHSRLMSVILSASKISLTPPKK